MPQLPEMLELLPDEILLMILQNLSPSQLAKVKLVCKKLNQMVTPQLIERAVKYVNYRQPHTFSDKLNFFSWDTNAEIFKKMKTNPELRTNFGLVPSKFTVTHHKTPDGSPSSNYTIQDAITKEPLGYFGNDCQELNSDKKLPMLNSLHYSSQKRISVLIQKNYILISDCMDSIYLFDGKNFISEFFWNNPKAVEKAREKLADKAEGLFNRKTNSEPQKTETASILSLGENKYLTISKFGEIRVWSITLVNNEYKISPTSDFNQIELPNYPNLISAPTQIQRAIFTKNNNILLACSDHRVIILNTSLELVKTLDVKKYKKMLKLNETLADFWGVGLNPKPENWPLLESLSQHNLIIIPPKTDQILVFDETKDFALHSIQVAEIDTINLGVILKSGEILLVTETGLKFKDLEVHPYQTEKSTLSKCNIS